jgi:hypothetical protein
MTDMPYRAKVHERGLVCVLTPAQELRETVNVRRDWANLVGSDCPWVFHEKGQRRCWRDANSSQVPKEMPCAGQGHGADQPPRRRTLAPWKMLLESPDGILVARLERNSRAPRPLPEMTCSLNILAYGRAYVPIPQ